MKTNNDIHSKQFLDGIVQIRNTPRADGSSPCQIVFGRSVRTLIPTLSEALGTNEFIERARTKKGILDTQQKLRYDLHAKDLKPLKAGTLIWIQNSETGKWSDTGRIKCKFRKRTYRIKMDNGKVTYLKRKRIRQKEDLGPEASNIDEREDNAVKERRREETDSKPRRSERIKEKLKDYSLINF